MKKKSRKLAGHKKHRRYNRTVKGHYSDLIIPSETPLNVHKLSVSLHSSSFFTIHVDI